MKIKQILMASTMLAALSGCGKDYEKDLTSALGVNGMPETVANCIAKALIEADFPDDVYESIIADKPPSAPYRDQVGEIIINSMMSDCQ